MPQWFVAMTKPNSELIAWENLTRQGYDCYFPRIQIMKGTKVFKKPLFPRYVFVKNDGPWHSIKGTRGISHLLMGYEGPATIPETVIEELRAREGRDGCIILGKPKLHERF